MNCFSFAKSFFFVLSWECFSLFTWKREKNCIVESDIKCAFFSEIFIPLPKRFFVRSPSLQWKFQFSLIHTFLLKPPPPWNFHLLPWDGHRYFLEWHNKQLCYSQWSRGGGVYSFHQGDSKQRQKWMLLPKGCFFSRSHHLSKSNQDQCYSQWSWHRFWNLINY